MARKLEFPVFDADNHMYETTEAFTRHLPAEYDGLIKYVEVNGRTKIALNNVISEYIPNPTFQKVAPPGAQELEFRLKNPSSKSKPGDQPVAPPKTVKRALVDSFIVEILNPKVALFFIALLPQFVDPTASLPVWAQFLILGTIVNFAFSSADLVTVFGASLVMKTMKASRAGFGIGRWLGGGMMIGLGVKLAVDKG